MRPNRKSNNLAQALIRLCSVASLGAATVITVHAAWLTMLAQTQTW